MNTNDSNTFLPPGTFISGLAASIKTLLLFVPFIFIGGCAGGEYQFSVASSYQVASIFPPFCIIYVLPLNILPAIVLLLGNIQTSIVRLKVQAICACIASCISLLGVIMLGYMALIFDSSSYRLLWGYWAIAATDITILVGNSLDLLGLTWPEPQKESRIHH